MMLSHCPLLFTHVPKAAGTSLRNAAEEHFRNRVLRDYGPTARATSPEIRVHVHQVPDREALARVLAERDIAMIAGHVPYQAYMDLIPPEQVVVLLRDPVQRVVSEYWHAVRLAGYSRTLLEFAEQPRQRNKQRLFVDGLDLDRAALVGLSEQYAASLVLLKRRTGITLRPLEHNKNPEKVLDNQYPITSAERERLLDLNADDVEVYERAAKGFALASKAEQEDPALMQPMSQAVAGG